MEEIKIYKDVEIKNPVMVAGWPGMGSVALGVVDYLRKKLGSVRFAEIRTDPLAALDSVIVDDGLAKLPPPPRSLFYYAKDPGIVIFQGDIQPPGASGIRLLGKVLDAALGMKIRRIYTGAALPLPVSHEERPEVYCSANKDYLLSAARKRGISVMENGHISGLNGLALGFAKERNMEAICLLATIPQYAVNLPNPKASAAIIEALQKMLNFKIGMEELQEQIKDMDEKMALIEDKVKDVLVIDKPDAESFSGDKKVPPYVMHRIEKLFREAVIDKDKAIALKRELDRWDLYKAYEDRFLDLFKNNR